MATTLKKKKQMSQENKEFWISTGLAVFYCSVVMGIIYYLFLHVLM